MLEAKNQLSKLVKAALAGEDAIIASHGKPGGLQPYDRSAASGSPVVLPSSSGFRTDQDNSWMKRSARAPIKRCSR